ncbi:MAG: Fic family protein [Methanosarcinaceae archaeon]
MALELGHKTVLGGLHKQVRRLVGLNFIEIIIPKKPNSRLQKYRLTGKGQNLLTKQKNGNQDYE